ncbi:hypothetical protein ACWCL1_00980 [Ligilactobacillus sp. LYQ135]
MKANVTKHDWHGMYGSAASAVELIEEINNSNIKLNLLMVKKHLNILMLMILKFGQFLKNIVIRWHA